MTELVQRVIAEIEKLPEEEQDAIARRILAELADEQAWAARFNATTDEQWDRLAEGVRREIAAGDTAHWVTFLHPVSRTREVERHQGVSQDEDRQRDRD